jgi:hypothetical protein
LHSSDCRAKANTTASSNRCFEVPHELEISRVEGLTLTHRHNPKSLKFYGSYTLGSSAYKPADWLESQIHNLTKVVKLPESFRQSETSLNQAELLQMLLSAYDRGFGWFHNLQRRMGIKIKPLSATQMWSLDWSKANKGKAPIIPQVLEITSAGLNWIPNSKRILRHGCSGKEVQGQITNGFGFLETEHMSLQW